MRKLLYTLSLVFITLLTFGQSTNAYYDTPQEGYKLVSETGTANLYPNAQRALESIYEVDPALIGDLTNATAAALDIVWKGHELGWNPKALNGSRDPLTFEKGLIPINFPITWAYSKISGASTNVAGDKSGPTFWNNHGSHLFMDHDRWPSWVDEIFGFRAVFVNNNVFSVPYSQWQESADIYDVRIDGNSHRAPDNIPTYGIYCGVTGENWAIAKAGAIYVHNFSTDGIHIETGAGPGYIGQVSSFDNHRAGLWAGSINSLGGLYIDQLSCDNNEVHLYMPNGGTVGFNQIKNETGLSESRGEPKRNSIAIKAAGWFDIQGMMVTNYSVGPDGTGATRSPILVDVDHTVGVRSSVKIGTLNGAGYNTLFSGKVQGVENFNVPFGDYQHQGLYWTSDGQGYHSNVGQAAPPPPNPVYGCTDPNAENYNPSATVDDGSCRYDDTDPPVGGIDYSLIEANESYSKADEQPEYIEVRAEHKGAGYALKTLVRAYVVPADNPVDWGWLTDRMQYGANGNLYLDGNDTGQPFVEGWYDLQGEYLFNAPGQWNALQCRITSLSRVE